MFDFLETAEPTLKIFWYVALPTSVIFLIQTVITFLGADASDGSGADFDSNLEGEAPFQLFSLRNLINFLLGFSWGGISLWHTITNKTWLFAVALLIGSGFVLFFFFVMQQMNKLQEDNTIFTHDALNKTGTVYLTIPANKRGFGKIQVSIRGSQREFQAVTQGEALETGTAIRVVEILDDNLCLVEKL
jgi:hypothetical protein